MVEWTYNNGTFNVIKISWPYMDVTIEPDWANLSFQFPMFSGYVTIEKLTPINTHKLALANLDWGTVDLIVKAYGHNLYSDCFTGFRVNVVKATAKEKVEADKAAFTWSNRPTTFYEKDAPASGVTVYSLPASGYVYSTSFAWSIKATAPPIGQVNIVGGVLYIDWHQLADATKSITVVGTWTEGSEKVTSEYAISLVKLATEAERFAQIEASLRPDWKNAVSSPLAPGYTRLVLPKTNELVTLYGATVVWSVDSATPAIAAPAGYRDDADGSRLVLSNTYVGTVTLKLTITLPNTAVKEYYYSI